MEQNFIKRTLTREESAEVTAILSKYGKDAYSAQDPDFTFEEAVRLEMLLLGVPRDYAEFHISRVRGLTSLEDPEY